MFLTSHVSAKTSVSFVVIRQSFSALYLNNNVPSCPILRFQEMDLPETPHLSPHTHYLHAVYTGYVRTVMKVILLAKYLAISQLTAEGFTENWCVGQNECTEYCQKQNLAVGV